MAKNKVKATAQDSIAVMNNAIKVNEYYKGKQYSRDPRTKIKHEDTTFPILNEINNIWNDSSSKEHEATVPGKNGKAIRVKFNSIEYKKNIDENRFFQREVANGILDTRAPMQLFDKRINPNLKQSYSNKSYRDPLGGDFVDIYAYDPIVVKPAAMKTKSDWDYMKKNYPEKMIKATIEPKPARPVAKKDLHWSSFKQVKAPPQSTVQEQPITQTTESQSTNYIGDYPDWSHSGRITNIDLNTVKEARKINPKAYAGFEAGKTIAPLKLPKYADGWYGKDGITKQGTAAASTIGGIGSMVSGVSGLLKTEDESSVGNYAGNILGDAGQYASIGAALGPWGAVGGAVLGAGMGLAKSIGADKAQNAQERQENINTNLGNLNTMSNQVNTKYNMRNFANDRVPGLNKGVVKFKSGITATNEPNALLASEEGVMDGYTGRLSMVPGQYNPSNPDVVPSNLTEGTSIFSNKKEQVIPGGKSTPADIIARAEKMQTINDKILTPKKVERRLSFIDQRTAEINRMNIKNQADNLNKYNALLNPLQSQSGDLPGFKDGVIAFSKDGVDYYETESTDGMKKGNPYYTLDKNKGRTYIDRNRAQYLKLDSVNESADLLAKSATTQFGKDKFENTGWKVNVPVNNSTTTTPPAVTPAVQATQSPTINTASQSNPAQTKARYGALKEKIVSPGDTKPVEAISSHSKASSPAVNTIAPPVVNSDLNGFKMDRFAPGKDMNDVGYDPIKSVPFSRGSFTSKDVETAKKLGDNSYIQNTPGDKGASTDGRTESTLGSDLTSMGNKLMSIAPGIYNAFNNKPEVTPAIYEDYINPNQRYNIAPELAESVKQRQIARYGNATQNTSTGANQAYSADLYSRGTDQLSDLMNRAQTANNSYRDAYASRYNEFGARNTAEKRRVQDVNMRNRAASRSFGAKNAEIMSQYGQMQELMGNQKQADMLNSNLWGAYASAMTKEDKKFLTDMLKKYSKR